MQQDQANRLAAANSLNSIAGQTQALGLGDINALSTLGGQQQTIAQNQQLFPMQQLTSEANLLKGATIPTATSSNYTGPIPGAYNASPLSQIAGLGSLATGIANLIPAINTSLPNINFTNPTSNSSGSSSSGNVQTPVSDANLPSGIPSGSVINSDGTFTAPNGENYNASGTPIITMNTEGPFAGTPVTDSTQTPSDYVPPPIDTTVVDPYSSDYNYSI
jgi:hypothetical protein